MYNPFEHPFFVYSKYPRHRGKLENYTHSYGKGNPSCGDEVKYYVLVEDGRIKDIRFEGHGCSVSQASADILAEWSKGRSVEEVLALEEQVFLDEILGGVIPTRIRCALLSLQTLKEALRRG